MTSSEILDYITNFKKFEQIQKEFNIFIINFTMPNFQKEEESKMEIFFSNLKIVQDRLKLVFFIEIPNYEYKELTAFLSRIITFLILYDIEFCKVFLIFKFHKSEISDEMLNLYTLAWIRSVPVSIGGIIVYIFNSFET